MSYAYSYENNSVSKWDTIQSDVSDAYRHLDDELDESPIDDFDDFDDSDDEALAKLYELTWEN
jgi:23S rRNA G2069 N7-methylase RlmK/C1962 C5-methylase RlmI